MQAHETLARSNRPEAANPRGFGLILAVVAAAIALWPLWYGAPLRMVWLLGAVGLALIALCWPRGLAVVERGFARLGVVLSRVMNPLLLGVMYSLLFVPIGLVMRWAGRDVLARRLDRAAPSYWIARDAPDQVGRDMRDMF